MKPDISHRLAALLRLDASIGIDAMPVEGRPIDNSILAHLPLELQVSCIKRQQEFLSGRCCAARALANAGYIGDGWLPVGDDRLPEWPSGWIGCISHSSFGAVAVATRSTTCRALGVDMEPLINATHASEIEATVACADELELLSALPKMWRVTLLFSAKEALFKALYPQVRRFQDFDAVRLCALGRNSLRLRLNKTWGSGWPEGFEVDVPHVIVDGHVYSVTYIPLG